MLVTPAFGLSRSSWHLCFPVAFLEVILALTSIHHSSPAHQPLFCVFDGAQDLSCSIANAKSNSHSKFCAINHSSLEFPTKSSQVAFGLPHQVWQFSFETSARFRVDACTYLPYELLLGADSLPIFGGTSVCTPELSSRSNCNHRASLIRDLRPVANDHQIQ